LKTVLKSLLYACAVAGSLGSAHAAIVITEVDAAGNSNGAYAHDWFELTNTGTEAVNVSGWKVDDNSFSTSTARTLTGITSIAAGETVIFADQTTVTSLTAFITNWFGSSAPVGLQIGSYAGAGIGLSNDGDGLVLFTGSNTEVTRLTWGDVNANASRTLDNAALGGTGTVLSTFSQVGVNGAFAGGDGRIGSPGRIANASPVPVPAAIWLLGSGLGLIGAARRRRAAAV
jgi:hypothetical protein